MATGAFFSRATTALTSYDMTPPHRSRLLDVSPQWAQPIVRTSFAFGLLVTHLGAQCAVEIREPFGDQPPQGVGYLTGVEPVATGTCRRGLRDQPRRQPDEDRPC